MKKRVFKGLLAAFSMALLSFALVPQEAAEACSGNWEDWYCTNGCSTQGFDSCDSATQKTD